MLTIEKASEAVITLIISCNELTCKVSSCCREAKVVASGKIYVRYHETSGPVLPTIDVHQHLEKERM